MSDFNVTVFAIVAVRFSAVTAESHADAIDSLKKVDMHRLLHKEDSKNGVEISYDDQVADYLVDVCGDETHNKSKRFDGTGQLLPGPLTEKDVVIVQQGGLSHIWWQRGDRVIEVLDLDMLKNGEFEPDRTDSEEARLVELIPHLGDPPDDH